MSGSLVADLGIGPEVWAFLSLVGCITLFFKFSRIWSVRNLDLLLLFALAPGLMILVASREKQPSIAFVLLFAGSACWLARCLIDLGLSRRPLLEPNLNAAGLACLSVGILGLLLAETVSLPGYEGTARNPADRGKHADPPPPGTEDEHGAVTEVLNKAPLPTELKRHTPQEILKRVLASVAHLGLVAGLITVGWWHFERPVAGLAMATCYLILPYTRIALVDCGQVVPAALIVAAVTFYTHPTVAGALIGLAAGWMPACLGLLPLWFGFYRRRGGGRFAFGAVVTVVVCVLLAFAVPGLIEWARALGARSFADAGMLPGSEAPETGSFWSKVDIYFRVSVLIVYATLVIVTSIWPVEKNLGELIALSAALLVASQFWYLAAGGTLVVLYLPLVLLMMFRPNLASKRAIVPAPSVRAAKVVRANGAA